MADSAKARSELPTFAAFDETRVLERCARRKYSDGTRTGLARLGFLSRLDRIPPSTFEGFAMSCFASFFSARLFAGTALFAGLMAGAAKADDLFPDKNLEAAVRQEVFEK